MEYCPCVCCRYVCLFARVLYEHVSQMPLQAANVVEICVRGLPGGLGHVV